MTQNPWHLDTLSIHGGQVTDDFQNHVQFLFIRLLVMYLIILNMRKLLL